MLAVRSSRKLRAIEPEGNSKLRTQDRTDKTSSSLHRRQLALLFYIFEKKSNRSIVGALEQIRRRSKIISSIGINEQRQQRKIINADRATISSITAYQVRRGSRTYHHATVDNSINLETSVRDAFINNENLKAICLDIEKAYDIVGRTRVIGVTDNLLHLVRNFLIEEGVAVREKNVQCICSEIENHTPRDSVISVASFLQEKLMILGSRLQIFRSYCHLLVSVRHAAVISSTLGACVTYLNLKKVKRNARAATFSFWRSSFSTFLAHLR